MRIGISTYSFAWSLGVEGKLPPKKMSIFQLIDLAAEHKLDCVQIADNLPLHLFDPTQLQKLKEYAISKNILIEPGARGLTKDHLLKYIEIASFFSSDILRFVIDNLDYKPTLEDVITIIKSVGRDLAANNVHLAIENHDRFLAKEFKNIVQEVNSDFVGICLDTVNSFGSLEGPEVVIDRLLPYTINVHVKDFIIFRESHKMGFRIEGRPAGEGMLDIPLLVKNIKQLNKDLDLILELWTPFQNNLEETIKLEENWAKKSILYLRGVI